MSEWSFAELAATFPSGDLFLRVTDKWCLRFLHSPLPRDIERAVIQSGAHVIEKLESCVPIFIPRSYVEGRLVGNEQMSNYTTEYCGSLGDESILCNTSEYIEAARKGIQQHGHSLAYAYRAIHRTPQVWLEIEILEADLLVSNQSESEIF